MVDYKNNYVLLNAYPIPHDDIHSDLVSKCELEQCDVSLHSTFLLLDTISKRNIIFDFTI